MGDGGGAGGDGGPLIYNTCSVEVEEIEGGGGEVSLEFFGVFALGEGVWIFAIGEDDDLDVHAFGEEGLDVAGSGHETGSVAIEDEGDVGAEAVEEAGMSDGECCATACYDVFTPA